MQEHARSRSTSSSLGPSRRPFEGLAHNVYQSLGGDTFFLSGSRLCSSIDLITRGNCTRLSY